jgi:hypothetical protein
MLHWKFRIASFAAAALVLAGGVGGFFGGFWF